MAGAESSIIYDYTSITDIALSPDCSSLAYVESCADPDDDRYRERVSVTPVNRSGTGQTLYEATSIDELTWAPEADLLGVIAPSASEDGTRQLWELDVETGRATQITNHEAGVREFDWDPTGERLVFVAEMGSDRSESIDDTPSPIKITDIHYKYDGFDWVTAGDASLFVYDTDQGKTHRLTETAIEGPQALYTGVNPAWGPNGWIAYLADASDDATAVDIRLVSPTGNKERKISIGTTLPQSLEWQPGGDLIAATVGSGTNWFESRDVYLVDSMSGGWQCITSSLDRTVARNGPPQWLDDESLVYLVGIDGRSRFALIERKAGEWTVTLPETEQSIDETIAQLDAGSGMLAYEVGSSVGERELFVASDELFADETEGRSRQESNDNRVVHSSNKNLLNSEAADYKNIIYEGHDSESVQGHLFLPPRLDNPPVIIWVHGGPMMYEEPAANARILDWVERGYGVFAINYHGSRSFGTAYATSVYGDWGPRETTDVIKGARHLLDKGWAEPERLYLVGFSQGAFYVARVLTRTDAFAAAVCDHGFYDLRSLYGTSDLHHWYETEFGKPWLEPERYTKVSVIDEVDAIETPVLVVAGGRDNHTPLSQSEMFYTRLAQTGTETKLVVYPDKPHTDSVPSWDAHRARLIDAWFQDARG